MESDRDRDGLTEEDKEEEEEEEEVGPRDPPGLGFPSSTDPNVLRCSSNVHRDRKCSYRSRTWANVKCDVLCNMVLTTSCN